MNAPDAFAASRDHAVALHRAGDIAAAIAAYEAVLRTDPNDAEMHGLLAMALFQSGREDAALASWRMSLALPAPAAVKLRIITNCLKATQQKAATQASPFAGIAIPQWPRDIRPDQEARRMLLVLAELLAKSERREEAVRLIDGVLAQLRDDADFVAAATATMLDCGRAERVSRILKPLTSMPDPVDIRLLITHAAAASRAGRTDEARRLSQRAIDALPVYLTPKEPGQTRLVGVLNRARPVISDIVSPARLHFVSNTPAKLSVTLNGQYRFLSVLPQAASAAQTLAGQPRPDVIWNNWVNPEMLSAPKTLEFIADFADRLGLPILNHPRKAVTTTRQKNAERLRGIAGLVVPRTLRIVNEPPKRDLLLHVIATELGFPVIIRDPFAQAGHATARIDDRDSLARHLAATPEPQLYATQYIDNPVAAGLYRKIRAAVIGPEIFITHVHFGRQWNVHRNSGAEALSLLDHNIRHKSIAARMIAEPEEVLGEAAFAALAEIRNRIPLDLFGVDFDLMPDGELLFFEANAAMNLSMSDRPGREKTRARMRAALGRLFEEPSISTDFTLG